MKNTKTDEYLAMKIMPKANADQDLVIERELRTLRAVDSPFMLKFKGFYEVD